MKKNNLFKTSLLLLTLNISKSYSDVEVDACYMGQQSRNGANIPSLMITGDENYLSGNASCNSLYSNIRQRAACIFGYNSNIGILQYNYDTNDTSKWEWETFGNGCDLSAMINVLQRWGFLTEPYNPDSAPDYFPRECIDCVRICSDFGKSIGWALNDDGSNTLNFYRNVGLPQWPNVLLNQIWGINWQNSYSAGVGLFLGGNNMGIANALTLIKVIANKKFPNSSGFTNSCVLGQSGCELNN